MAKFLLLSILIVTMAMPMALAKAKNARTGLRRVVIGMAIYIVLWVLFCTYLFLRLGGGY